MINAIRLFFASITHPKRLELTPGQASYVESLFMGGADPEAIGRAMDKTYSRKSWKYFQVPNARGNGFEFAETVDYYLDGLEYLRSAMIALGAMTPRKDGDYYEASHPMVQKLASIAANAPIPEHKRR